MRQVVLLTAAAGSLLVALLFGKTSDNDWADVLMSVFCAGSAGVLLVMAGL